MAALCSTLLNSAIRLPPIGIGTAPLGGLYLRAEPEEGVTLLRQALHRGARYFDSALLYGGGQALEILGAALGPAPLRDYPDLVISFKVGRLFVSGPEDPLARGKELHSTSGFPACSRRYVYDYSAAGVRAAFRQSFEAMNHGRATRNLPPLSPGELPLIVFVHDPGVAEHGDAQPAILRQVLDEAFPELWDMQQRGLLHAYGLGTNEIEPCISALHDPHIKLLMLAGHGTLLCNGAPAAPPQIQAGGPALDRLLGAMKAHANTPRLAIAAIGNSGLAFGGNMYNYVPAPAEMIAFRDRLFAAIREFLPAAPPPITQILVAFPFAALGAAVATVVSGPRSASELASLLNATDAPEFPEAFWNHLAAKGLIRKACSVSRPAAERRIG